MHYLFHCIIFFSWLINVFEQEMLVCKNAIVTAILDYNCTVENWKERKYQQSRLILTRMLKGLSYTLSYYFFQRVNPKNALFRHLIKSRASCSPLIGTSQNSSREIIKLFSRLDLTRRVVEFSRCISNKNFDACFFFDLLQKFSSIENKRKLEKIVWRLRRK